MSTYTCGYICVNIIIVVVVVDAIVNGVVDVVDVVVDVVCYTACNILCIELKTDVITEVDVDIDILQSTSSAGSWLLNGVDAIDDFKDTLPQAVETLLDDRYGFVSRIHQLHDGAIVGLIHG